MSLSEFISSKYNDKSITVTAIVTGKSDMAYTVPTSIKIKNGAITLSSSDLLRFIDKSTFGINKIANEFIKACPFRAKKDYDSYKTEKHKSILRVYLSDTSRKEQKTFTCYFIGTDIEVNQVYEFTGTVIADPKTQNTTAIFESAKKLPSQIEAFSITKEVHNKLNEFCVTPNAESIMMHLHKLYTSYAGNVTHIYDRYDLHLAIDLAFHSPLSFTFDGEYFHKGWSDIAIIGDTRVGKGFVAEGLQKYYGVGEVVSGDNATLTGLIGGLKTIDKNWTVQWGKFVQNDRGLLILDESSKLSKYTISHLTRLRSEGIAEIHKIHSYSAPARVRAIFIFNPGNGKLISQYAYGIQSILSVFKDPATVSRFDYVLVVSKNEADTESVNKARATVPEIFSQELEQQLIYWTWSRTNEQIFFSESAKEKIYILALDLSNRFTDDIPLIQAENIRYKLAKIAACFAARVYSTRYSGKHLFVDTVHVECAWLFLDLIYKKPASSYLTMSAIKKSLERDNEQSGLIVIEKYFTSFYQKRMKLLQVLLTNQNITMTDISDQADLPKDIALEVVSKLVRHRLIERSGFVYVKTPRFTTYLREEISKSIQG